MATVAGERRETKSVLEITTRQRGVLKAQLVGVSNLLLVIICEPQLFTDDFMFF